MNENRTETPEVSAKITWMNNTQNGSKKATASITIANAFVVKGLGVIEGPKGLFVSMPKRTIEKSGEKKYSDVAHPVTADMRNAVNDAVMEAYERAQALAQQFKEEHANGKATPKYEESPVSEAKTQAAENAENTDDAEQSEDNLPFEMDFPDEENIPIMGHAM